MHRKKFKTSIMIVACKLFLFLFISKLYAYEIQGKAVKITDGDTIWVLDFRKNKHKIRLAGIDCPERKQPFGGKAKRRVADLVGNILVISDCSKTDKYG